MHRRFLWLIFIGLLPIILFCLPVKALQEFRNDIAYTFVLKKQDQLARPLYRLNAWQGDRLAINNYHVLNYRLVRHSKKQSKPKLKKANEKAKAAFEDLASNGYAPAAYNRGMFYFKKSSKSRNYPQALHYFKQGADLGDSMSQDALDFMRAKQFKKEAYYEAIRPIADRGNGWAAYRYVKAMRRDRHKLANIGQNYALIAAKSGLADAQQFLGEYFPERHDAAYWLEQAATKPVNPNIRAARSLADLALKYGDEEARRKWLSVATKPREEFRYTMIIEPEGLRWRDFQNSRARDGNNSEAAAYELALMQLAGLGGPVKKRAAIKNLKYAKDWADAKSLIARVKSGDLQNIQKKIQTEYAEIRSGSESREPDYALLNAYIDRGDLRLASKQDVQKFESAATMMSKGKGGYHQMKFNLVMACKNFPCYYVERPITLPDGMFGAYASTFLIDPNIDLPQQLHSHNRYVFLNRP